MTRILGLLGLLAFGSGLVLASETYKAIVVELSPTVPGDTVPTRVAARLKKITDQITADPHKDADIIVFPEYGITEAVALKVPDPKDKVVLCDNAEYDDNSFQAISCAAKTASTYVVINALTQHDCAAEQKISKDDRPCASNNINVYNTNIVFDRTGAVISIYRKFNIYNEDLNTTVTPDVSTFDTDFDVTFGHFICFDIMFEEPSASLLKLGVKNFVFPAMWFSELPFLTAVQIQQSWAMANNVNLLAAGISKPDQGSTGSGIYSGKQGALAYQFSGTSVDKVLIADISKEPGSSTVSVIPIPTKSPTVQMIRDQLDSYKSVKLNVLPTSTEQRVCNENDFCCDFKYVLEDIGETENTVAYEYVAAVYNGSRTYGGKAAQQRVVSCAVFTCVDATDIATCGGLLAGTPVNRYFFKELSISGVFRHNDTFLMANTLAVGLVPLPATDFTYTATVPEAQGEYLYQNVSITLDKFNQHLLTFGIWGRSSAFQPTAALAMVVFAVIFSLVI